MISFDDATQILPALHILQSEQKFKLVRSVDMLAPPPFFEPAKRRGFIRGFSSSTVRRGFSAQVWTRLIRGGNTRISTDTRTSLAPQVGPYHFRKYTKQKIRKVL